MATDDTHQEIEEAFMASWDRIERFYVRTFFWRTPLADIDPSEVKTLADSTEYKSRYEKLKPRLGLIAEMRKQGYDRQLRAGSSLSSLVLSRSREFGLRPDQAMLRITLS